MAKKKKLEWYVLNGDFNAKTVKMFNIFDNWALEEEVKSHIKKYNDNKFTYEEFKEEVRKSIMYHEWGRCEYEIYVCAHPFYEKEYWKQFDCYDQVLPNLDILCKYLLDWGKVK